MTTTQSEQSVREDIVLSTGRTVMHSRMENGAQDARIKDSLTGEMTQVEWDEYCDLIQYGLKNAYKLELINKRQGKRDWSTLPQGFELDSVRAAFQDIKGLFNKDQIKQRIKASKAQTFSELTEAIK